MASLISYDLPDTLASWPWPRSIHPCADSVVAESVEWFRAFHAFNNASQRAFDKCNVGERILRLNAGCCAHQSDLQHLQEPSSTHSRAYVSTWRPQR